MLRVTVRRAGLLVNGYLVGGERNEWALIDVDSSDERHRALLLSSAPGPVRWVLSAREMAMAPGERIDLGGCGLRVLGQGWLLEEERMLFAAEAPAAPDRRRCRGRMAGIAQRFPAARLSGVRGSGSPP